MWGWRALGGWLRADALEDQRRNLTRSFVLVGGGQVTGYYSLTMGGVSKDELPRRYAKRLPEVFETGMVLLARLAVSVDRRGSGLGRDLLVDAIAQAAAAGTPRPGSLPWRRSTTGPAPSTRPLASDIPGDRDEETTNRMYVRLDEAISSFGSSS